MSNPILLAILTALGTAGLIGFLTKPNVDGSNSTTIFNSEGNPLINVPNSMFTEEIALNSFRSIFARVSGITVTSKPSNSQIKIVNSAQGNKLLGLSIIPDSAMQTSGSVEVEVNGTSILNCKAGELADTGVIDLPIANEGLELAQSSSIEIFIHSPSGVAVALTALISTGAK